MKKLILATVLSLFSLGINAQTSTVADARDVIKRTFGKIPHNVVFSTLDKGATDTYTLQCRNGKLYVEGTSAVALCRGFYDFITSNGYGCATWSGKRLDLPLKLKDMAKKSVTSPFRHHLYMNVCTYGYTMPFWGWDEWQEEIDRMALHGIDMPLAPIGGEAILARVWSRMGLTQEEIDNYFTGPAHMPWMRMGNMTTLDGAPTPQWQAAQIALQHKIIERMKTLGMKPVYQGFAGFVPKGMKRLHPDMAVTETRWAGFTNYILSPLDKLFTQIGSQFITEWEREFGVGEYYLIDSFNEMDIPFGEKGSPERAATLHRYGETIYKSMSSASPDAVWVMQGWMFGYQPQIWDAASVEALLSGAPDGKMMIIDLAVDFNNYVWRSENTWNKYDGMYNKDWIYSTVPNFGGRSALTGVAEFYANGHLAALASPNRGKLTGYGTSPEGVENNDPIYEIIAAAGWSDKPIDARKMLHNYSLSMYGSAPAEIDAFWDGMLSSVYNDFTNNARFRWQMRPVQQRMTSMGINEHYFEAISRFLDCKQLHTNKNYRNHAVEYAALYLGARAEQMIDAIMWNYAQGNNKQAQAVEQEFFKALTAADRLLESHSSMRLERWLDKARKAGCTPEESARFEREALRLITLWGGPSLYDYSARVWSGIIRDYYIPRWRYYLGQTAQGNAIKMSKWDEEWFDTVRLSKVSPYPDPMKAACSLVKEFSHKEFKRRPETGICTWLPEYNKSGHINISTTIPQQWMPKLKGLKFTSANGNKVTIKKVTLRANNKDLVSLTPNVSTSAKQKSVTIAIAPDVKEELSKEVKLSLTLSTAADVAAFGTVEAVW